jgi:ParB family chromosome partitioning protein
MLAHKYVEPIIEEDHQFQPVEHGGRDAMRKLTAHRFEGYFLPLAKIIVEPGYNPRFATEAREEHIRWIADQIKEHGFDIGKPITGFINREGFFVITDGHCRYEATLLAISEGAEVLEIPCLLESKTFTDEDRALALFRRNEGKRLEPLEVAILLKRLEGFGWAAARIANEIKKSITHVENMLALAGSPAQVREMVSNGKVATSLAIETIKKEGAAGAISTLKAALVDATERGKPRATAKAVQRVSLQKGYASIDWKNAGPKLQKALQSIVDADNEEILSACIAQSRSLLRAM